MTLKTSSNNPMHGFGTSYVYALRKSRGSAMLYLGLCILFLPVIFTLICSAVRSSYTSYLFGGMAARPLDEAAIADLTSTMQGAFLVLLSVLVKPLSIAFSVVFGVQLFGYMHKKRSVDTFHALPVRRVPFLAANLAAAATLLFVPIIFSFLVCGVVACANQAMLWAFWGKFLLPLLGYTLLGLAACFAFILFLLVASGTVMDAVVSAVILSIAYPALYALVQAFLQVVLQGYAASWDVSVISAFSPFLAYFLQIWWTCLGIEGVELSTIVVHVPWPFTLWWVLLTVLLAGGALWLYRCRKSEHAESTYAFLPLKELMKFLISAACAFGMGFVAVLIYSSDVVFLLFALLGAFAANTAVEALYSRGLRHFVRGNIIYGAFAVLFLAFYTITGFGAFGYAYTAPAAKDVAYVVLEDWYGYTVYDSTAEDATDDTLLGSLMETSMYGNYYLRTSDGRYISTLENVYESQADIEDMLTMQKALAGKVGSKFSHISRLDDYNMITLRYHLFDGSDVVRTFKLTSEERDWVEEELSDLMSGGLQNDVKRQMLQEQAISGWELRYEEYTHQEELDALDDLSDEERTRKLKELEDRYGDDLYGATTYFLEMGTDRDGVKTQMLLDILSRTPADVAFPDYNYSWGSVDMTMCLEAAQIDSAYVRQAARVYDDAYIRVDFCCDFGADAKELIEFIKAYGVKG